MTPRRINREVPCSMAKGNLGAGNCFNGRTRASPRVREPRPGQPPCSMAGFDVVPATAPDQRSQATRQLLHLKQMYPDSRSRGMVPRDRMSTTCRSPVDSGVSYCAILGLSTFEWPLQGRPKLIPRADIAVSLLAILRRTRPSISSGARPAAAGLIAAISAKCSSTKGRCRTPRA
jgi:hypothetical protein